MAARPLCSTRGRKLLEPGHAEHASETSEAGPDQTSEVAISGPYSGTCVLPPVAQRSPEGERLRHLSNRIPVPDFQHSSNRTRGYEKTAMIRQEKFRPTPVIT
jgi:hypothetical protein